MPRTDRTFTCIDLVRLWSRNLNSEEQECACLLIAMACSQRRAELFFTFIFEVLLSIAFLSLPARLFRPLIRFLERRVQLVIQESVFEVVEFLIEPSVFEEALNATSTTP